MAPPTLLVQWPPQSSEVRKSGFFSASQQSALPDQAPESYLSPFCEAVRLFQSCFATQCYQWMVQDLDIEGNRRHQIRAVFSSLVLPGNPILCTWQVFGLSNKCDISFLHLAPCECPLLIRTGTVAGSIVQNRYSSNMFSNKVLRFGGFLKTQINMYIFLKHSLYSKILEACFQIFELLKAFFHRHAKAQLSEYHFPSWPILWSFSHLKLWCI